MSPGTPTLPERTRVLVIDDDSEDMELVVDLLRDAPGITTEVTWASTYQEGLRFMGRGETDVCLVDYRLGAETGIDFLKEPDVVRSGVPVILMTGRGTPEVDEKALLAGAADYLLKDKLSSEGLGRALRFAVERRRRQRSESLARALIGSVQEILSILDPATGEFRFVSPSSERVLGFSPAEALGRRAFPDVHPDDRERLEDTFRRVGRSAGERAELRFRVRHVDGGWRTLDSMAENHVDDPDVAGIVLSSRDITDRVEREERIRFQASLLEAVGQAVVATDLSGAVTYWNSTAERMHGWSAEEAVGRNIIDLVMPEEDASEAGEIMQSLPSTGDRTGEHRVRRKDGSSFLALVSSSLIRDASGNPVGTIGTSTDISALKETEAALRERVKELRVLTRASEILNRQDLSLRERLQLVVETIPSGCTQPKHTAARLVLGDEVLSSPRFRTTPWSIGIDFSTPEENRRLEVAFTGPVPDGAAGQDPFLPEEEEVLENVARLVGDAARREALQRVLTQTFSAIQEAVLVIDRSGGSRGISYVNPAAERIFGYSRDELVGGTTERLHLDHRSFLEFGRESVLALARHGVFHGDFRLRRKDGTAFDAEQTVTLLDPSRGLEGGAVSVIRDVSERTAMEEQLRQMQKMESVGQLAGGIAHDFNNVLTVIRSQVDLIILDLEEGPVVEDLQLVRKAADRATTLTAQLLAFSREQILLPKTVDLGAVVRDAGQLLERLIGEQVQMVYRLAPDLPPVRVDPNRLEQVLMNLAVNARDAMPQGGTLEISTALEEIAPEGEKPGGPESGTWIVLTVEDNGSGMTPEVARRAFDPFFSTKGRERGTGLGLAMVYGTVKQSGGSIELESEPGSGTRFTLRFPLADTSLVPPADPPPDRPEPAANGAARSDAKPGSILVIDDDPAVRRAVVRVLERSGFRVVGVDDAESGLECLASSERFDAVLSDLVLPGMSGFDLLSRIRVERPELPLFAISGYVEGSPDRKDAIPPGVTFIQKPFSARELAAAVEGAVRGTLPPGTPRAASLDETESPPR
jgi:two-component system, cell cycle sensor histidine kinase and response regulator CckA